MISKPILISDFDPKDHILKPKLSFSHFYVNIDFITDTKISRKYIFALVLSMKTWKNTPSKVGYFSKTAEKYSIAQNGQICPANLKFFNVSYIYLVHIFGISKITLYMGTQNEDRLACLLASTNKTFA